MTRSFKAAAAGAIAIVLVFVGVTCYRHRDAFHDAKIASADVHHAAAVTVMAKADTAHAQGVVLRKQLQDLVSSPAVQADPIAIEVAGAGAAVIAKADTEIVDLRTANHELEQEAKDLRDAGKSRGPRLVPYLEPLYTFRSSGPPAPVIRLGADYRLLPHVSVKLEASYEPPPGPDYLKPEYRVTVGGRITFR